MPGKHTLRGIHLFQGIRPIKLSQIPAEIAAGLTLAALSIPEVMGYTKISGTPVITGLYTMLVPMAVFALLGSSRHLVVAADSATAAILAGALTGKVAPGSPEWLALAGVLALLAAALLIVARLIRLGFLADFLSRTVLVGFLTGVGVQVAAGEISGMLGLRGQGHGTIRKLVDDAQQIGHANFYALGLSATVLVVVVVAKKISKKIPAALIALAGTIVASAAFHLGDHGVQLLGTVPSGLPHFGPPHVHVDEKLVLELLPTAFAMFVVILAQSAATSRAYAARFNERFSENVDLVGLSLANVGAAFSGTFVVNGSPTKTQMVDSAGGRTQLSQIATSIIVLFVILFLTGPLAFLPTAVLSAVVFLIGVELVDVKGMREIWAQRRPEFWVALITAVVVVTVGVEYGIVLAMVLSLIDHVRRSYHPMNVVIGGAPNGWRTLSLSNPDQLRPGLMAYRFTHSMYYANADRLFQEVTDLVEQAKPPITLFCIEASAVAGVDFTAAATLRSIHGVLAAKGIRLIFADVLDESVRADLERYGLVELIGKDGFYTRLRDVVEAYDAGTSTA
jgi:high affinity sulfate transporter 1